MRKPKYFQQPENSIIYLCTFIYDYVCIIDMRQQFLFHLAAVFTFFSSPARFFHFIFIFSGDVGVCV